MIAGIVAAIDPAVPAGTVVSAVHAVAARSGQRRRLAWALEDEPGLLTGAGARAPMPSVLRLIGMLLRRWRQRYRPPGMPGLRPGHPPAPADRRAVVVR